MNLRDHTQAWLDSIGADGLMTLDGAVKGDVITKEEFADFSPDAVLLVYRVPAYRHADGSYHTEKEATKDRGVKPEQIIVEE
ncbi:hypothetical protein M0R72_18595 [Candidatus Pacearchaeota archaeon]|nr:hypothetical protein [Candidatus Pacearchaeota archaeon]